jgi:hypothetical protein
VRDRKLNARKWRKLQESADPPFPALSDLSVHSLDLDLPPQQAIHQPYQRPRQLRRIAQHR